jgi:hypothetical protein
MLGDCIRLSLLDCLGGGYDSGRKVYPSLSSIHIGDKVMRTLKLTAVVGLLVLKIPLLVHGSGLGSITRGVVVQLAAPIYGSSLEET